MNKKSKTVLLTSCAIIAAAAIGIGIKEFIKFYKPVEYKVACVSKLMKSDTKLIAHRGFRAIAPENTLPAFEEAGRAGFWGNECDIYRTADGVWVIHHDYITFRMMNASKNIEKSTYNELLELHTKNGINIEKYNNLKICTLEEYLDVCQRFQMNAFIELKSKNNTEHYDEIMNLINKYGVEHTFISFKIENLRRIRELDKEANLLYIVEEISDEAINLAKSIDNCGIDFNVDKDKNYKNNSGIIKKCTAEGISLGAWAVDTPEQMKKLVDLGVKYITTDCLTEY